jgi:murein L,D-transpeptidase YcbB/YkuD
LAASYFLIFGTSWSDLMGTWAGTRISLMAGLLASAAVGVSPALSDPAADAAAATQSPAAATASETNTAAPATPAPAATPDSPAPAQPVEPTAGAAPAADPAKPATDAAAAPATTPQAVPPDAAAVPAVEPSKAAETPAAAPATAPAPAATAETPAPATPPAATAETPSPAPAATAAETPASAPAAATAAAPPPADPVVTAIVAAAASKFDEASAPKAEKADVAALAAYYQTAKAPLWIKDGALTSHANAVLGEFRKAADWGLDPAAYEIPEIAAGATPEELGDAEARISLSALRYARQARGGRVDPLAISNIWDMTPERPDPAAVMADLAAAAEPAAYLIAQHPKHEGFVKLREALLKARGPQTEEPIDDALKVVLPEKGTLKPGQRHADVPLLRKRLKMVSPSEDAEDLYDPILVEAVKGFQVNEGFKANGQLNPRTRVALNAAGKPKKTNRQGEIDRITLNLERWRWLPANLGDLYVINNIPEFVGRVYKGDERVFEERIIIGQTTWATPLLASEMRSIVFRPSWGVPDGIKTKELLPRLKQAGGGGGFFEQLFGGGGGGGGRVLKAYGLTPYLNGRPVDPDKVDWSKVNIRQFSFTQPPGAKNPLGEVKFMFPNRHDVYMHDTTQRELFSQSFRALSHGCIRVQNPRRLAEVLLGEDKGWDAGKVRAMYNSGGEVALDKAVPVYLAYFTARVDDEGKLRTYADLYGSDSRLMSALAGRAVRYEAPRHTGGDLVASETEENYRPSAAPQTTASISESEAEDEETPPPQPAKKQQKKKEAALKKKKGDTTNDILTNALSGLVAN